MGPCAASSNQASPLIHGWGRRSKNKERENPMPGGSRATSGAPGGISLARWAEATPRAPPPASTARSYPDHPRPSPSDSRQPMRFMGVPEVGLEPTRPCGHRILNPNLPHNRQQPTAHNHLNSMGYPIMALWRPVVQRGQEWRAIAAFLQHETRETKTSSGIRGHGGFPHFPRPIFQLGSLGR